MENITGKLDEHLLDNLLKEAYQILNHSTDLNEDREKLTNILNNLVYWTNEQNHLENYFNEFQRMICLMASLDFSGRLSLNPSLKTFQNLISVSLNTLNEELEDKVFPKALVRLTIDKLGLKNTVIIQTNKDGYIKLFHTDRTDLYPDAELFDNLQISAFIEDMEEVEKKIFSAGTDQIFKVKLKSGYKDDAILKIATNQFYNISEGTVYIIQLPC
ncbi:hypothetical protein MYP_361 [Sporocytophaga myxococcoides]|uniref:Uncharacterized protein n=1 Tax=Sporocytophaga myxococcoides TaxID=153721 RepID=A0A098L8J9_9BACT|nr:hypothetical protein [Sporocytophaga myxococcoides]GAL83135.1 hypothetical protein MYP_361 [Sporocytophaga myxococcoides]